MDSDEMTRLITDEYASKILMAAYSKNVTAMELSRNFDIPIAACYRRLHSLETAGFLNMTGETMGHHGKKIKQYRSLVKSATVTFVAGKMMTRLVFVDGQEMKMDLRTPEISA